MSCARAFAQEVVTWYLDHTDQFISHEENVQKKLRQPIEAATLSILLGSSEEEEEEEEEPDKKVSAVGQEKQNGEGAKTWRDYIEKNVNASSEPTEWDKPTQEAIEALGRRTRARMDAFLEGVVLAVPFEVSMPPTAALSDTKKSRSRREGSGVSLIEGLAGFQGSKRGKSPLVSSLKSAGLLRSLSVSSSQNSVHPTREYPQIRKEDLMTRTELYIRSLYRVKSLHRECVLDVEPVRAVKARAQSLVLAFIDTVGTVRQQSPVLTRLLHCLTRELLAVGVLGENIVRVIRRVVSDYEQKTSFASLAFLSSPEKSADQALTPMVLKFIRYLQHNWELCESECELERFLSLAINPHVRNLFKTIEFQSIGHLLEVCQEVRGDLQHIEIEPDETLGDASNEEAIHQALRDLRREIITVNGHVLPPVTSRQELCHLLSQTLNSRTLANGTPRRKSRRRKGTSRRSEKTVPPEYVSSGMDSSGVEADSSATEQERPTSHRRRSSFQLSTVDFLTRRLLLAAGRTGTGGDAYFVVRDLFGGEDVEVVPSRSLPTHGHAIRPGTIEIVLKLASVTINCHGSFDIFPKSLVGECEPLIQVHTTTTETIALREARRRDSSDDAVNDVDYSSVDDAGEKREMVVEEMKTARTGWKILSIRPALYEKVDVWNTPS